MGMKFAVFDIDGTLIRWQLYHVIVDKLAGAGHLGPSAKEKLKQERMVWKRREHPDAFKKYESLIIQLYESALEHLKPEQFDKFVSEIIEEYKDQTYVYSRQLLDNLKKQGFFLLIISGSHQELIEQIAQHYGFDDFIASAYHRKNGKYTGTKFIPNMDKAKALKSLIEKHDLDTKDSVGIGDSGSDIAMLDLVDKPVAFNPDERLLTAAKNYGWQIVIERKSVIYKLEKHDGRYILA